MNNKKPLLSIITICFNETNVGKTCKSIVSQDFFDFEWIVIDGGSDEDTLNILNQYKQSMSVFISEKDDGIYDAMNKGIKKASGQWIIFMNAGDYFYNNNILKKVFSNKTYDEDLLFGDGTNNTYYNKHPLPIDKKHKVLKCKFFENSSFCHQAMFYRRELFKKYGSFDVSYQIIADQVFNYKLIDNGVKYKYLPYIIAIVDVEGISMINVVKLTTESKRFKKEVNNVFVRIILFLKKCK